MLEESHMHQQENGKDISLMLAITQSEALKGVEWPLVLSGGRKVMVKIPAHTQAGQTVAIPNAGKSTAPGGSRGTLFVTVAIRPDPSAMLQVMQHLEALGKSVRDLEKRSRSDQGIERRIEIFKQDIIHALEAQNEQVAIEGPADIVRYVTKHLPPGITILISLLALLVILSNCILFNVLSTAIATNGNSNIQAIMRSDAYMTATAQAQSNAAIAATGTAKAKADDAQAGALQNAADAQQVPQQYHLEGVGSAQILFNDLINKSNAGQWSQLPPENEQSCYFGRQDNFYHATMRNKAEAPRLCLTSGTVGTLSPGERFVLQVQMAVLSGDVGGVAFGNKENGFLYVCIKQSGEYEIGLNNRPFSNGTGQSNTIIKGTGPRSLNLIGVVVYHKTITFYVNLQPIFSIDGVVLGREGTLAVLARSDGSPTDVAYQKIKVWTIF
jgi:hypothetical protein